MSSKFSCQVAIAISAAAAILVLEPDVVLAARDTTIFAQGKELADTFNSSIVTIARSIGIGALIVCGILWIVTGRQNMKILVGALGGLFIAAAAQPIVNFMFPS
jgi:hypothetical protein